MRYMWLLSEIRQESSTLKSMPSVAYKQGKRVCKVFVCSLGGSELRPAGRCRKSESSPDFPCAKEGSPNTQVRIFSQTNALSS